MGARTGIEHVVVLMLENRSFDCMLGKLYPSDASFAGLTGNEKNLWNSHPVLVWPSGCDTLDSTSACIPDPDPGELFVDMNTQLFGNEEASGPATMGGFVQNYMSQVPMPGDCGAVMHYFTDTQVPMISQLARSFGVSDQWYASAPCQTWPNRFFAHTGTCLGFVNNDDFHIPFDAPSIFRRLSDCGKSWRVYFHDVPQSILLRDVWSEAVFHYRFFSTFLSDAKNGALPSYSFIEPQYFPDLFANNPANDEHPPHNVLYGEQLIADVYNAVRGSPCWKKTLLIITYDEHGGCFDHMPPPAAVPPDGKVGPGGFPFNRYGVRVPAVIVSPYMPPGSKVRAMPDGKPSPAAPYPFDHTSIIKTLRILFGLGGQLTDRDAAAPDLLGALSLDEPTNDGPPAISPKAPALSIAALERRAAAKPNHMQRTLSQMAAQLPPTPLPPDAPPPPPGPLTAPPPDTAAKAQASAVLQVKSFLGL